MAIKCNEAYVLKRSPLRETSLLLTLFSRGAGKIKGIVKGARKEKNPTVARFEPFTLLSVVYYEKLKSDIHLISESAVLDSNSFLRGRLDYFGYASYLAELVDLLFGPHDPHADVFDLLGAAFEAFHTVSPARVARVFEVKALERAGLFPNLKHCVSCGKKEFERPFFSPKQGGLICRGCEADQFGTFPVSSAAVRQLLFLLGISFDRGVQTEIEGGIQRELERLVRRFLQFRLEYPLRSSLFLSEIKTLPVYK